MKGHVGDRLVIKGHRVGEPDRDAEILQVHGGTEEPPFTVRWSDTGHETLIFPGADARVLATPHRAPDLDGIHVEWLGEPARTSAGTSVLGEDESVALLRRHIDLERLRTTDTDAELWGLWQEEARAAAPADHNADVLDRVLERLRTGD